MDRILIIKTGALGDVLRTTAIVPGLKQKHPGSHVTWVTAPAAIDLVRHHPGVDDLVAMDAADATSVEKATDRLQSITWDRVISLDDEPAPCRLARQVAPVERISGGWETPDGSLTYTADTEPWFGMGLLSRAGKKVADRRKAANRRSHPDILCSMLGVTSARPELPAVALTPSGDTRVEELRQMAGSPRIGLNTGAGGRWPSKELPEERVVTLVEELESSIGKDAVYLLLGGPEERDRNARLAAALSDASAQVVNAGTDHPVMEFAAIVSTCDLLVTSDSLAMHIAIARQVPTVAFFAPTSPHEIDLFGCGEKVVSTGEDACSYRADADTSSLTAGRIARAAERVLSAVPLDD